MYPYYYPNYSVQSKPCGIGMYPSSGSPPMGLPKDIPIPGTTSGMPVTSTTPAPTTIRPIDNTFEPAPQVTTDMGYTQAYLKTQIGQKARIEFLIGTNLLTDRIGTIVDVGISYILIQLQESDDIMLGDIYSIKFVTIYK